MTTKLRIHGKTKAQLKGDPLIGMLSEPTLLCVVAAGWAMLTDKQKRQALESVHDAQQSPADQALANTESAIADTLSQPGVAGAA